MEKPLIKDYVTPFSLDNSIVCFDSKTYAKKAAAYIQQQEKQINDLYDMLRRARIFINAKGGMTAAERKEITAEINAVLKTI